MATKLFIIGAGNVGGYISYNIKEFGDYEIVGFLDDDSKKHGQFYYGQKVLGGVNSIEDYLDENGAAVVISIANPKIKRKIADQLSGKNVYFPNFIGKNVWLSEKVTLGQGVILYPGVSVNYETYIGDFVIMNMNCAIGHNCYLSGYVTLAPGVNLGGFTYIGEATDMGIGSATRQSVKIGANSIVGGQAMVVKDVQDSCRVKGVPAVEF